MQELSVRSLGAMRDIDRLHWDACAGTENPFLSYAFFSSLEDSGTACADTGWLPQHLGVFAGPEMVGAVPLYLKSNSQGEFIFDYHWADAYERAGGAYYPKLQVAVPFTPVPGARLLLKNPDHQVALLDALRSVTEQLQVSSLHITFCPKDTFELGKDPWLQRTGLQFHWHNRGYASFQDFLDSLSARKRKAIRKEREGVQESGLELLTLNGDSLREEHWEAFYAFYMDTCSRKWGGAQLTREFFQLLHERMRDRVVLMLARSGDRYVAGALNLLGDRCLYGRNWGCLGHYPFLHFELCYYRAIDFAIERGLERVEAGAQGLHKVARGYEPVHTYSLHYIRDPRFRALLKRVLLEERAAVDEQQEEIARSVPFRKESQ